MTAPTLKWHNIKSEDSYSGAVKTLRFLFSKIWNSDIAKLRWAPEQRIELVSVMLISIIMNYEDNDWFVWHFSRTEMIP